MKGLLRILLALVILGFWSNQPMAQWVQTNGPQGGEIKCMTVMNDMLFVGTEIGVYRSNDNGTNWTQTGLKDIIVVSLSASSASDSKKNLFAGTMLGGVFLSTDHGENWKQVNFGLGNHTVKTLAVSDTILFAGTEDGVFLSPSNGDYWIPASTGLTNTFIRTLTGIGQSLYAGTDQGLYISTDQGTSWNPVGLAQERINAVAKKGTNLFVGTDTSGVFLSTDNGENWDVVSNRDMDRNVRTLAVNGSDLFAGTSNGLFRTPSDGAYWIPANTGLTNKSIAALCIKGSDLFAGTSAGVFHSTNNGANWTEVNDGLNTTVVYSFATSGDNLYAGTRSDMYRTSDRGDSWKSFGMGWINSIAISGANIYGGAWGHLAFSTDNGESWDWLQIQKAEGRLFSLALLNSYIFAGTEGGGVFRITKNAPGWWTILYTGQPDTIVTCLAVSGNHLFAGTAKGVYLSTNEGMSWTAVNNGFTNLDVRALAVSGTNLFAGTSGGGVFRSTDNAASWTPATSGLPNVCILSFAVNGDHLFAGTWQGGVFLTTDQGAHWTDVNTGLMHSMVQPGSVVHALAVHGTDLYAGTYGAGVWRRSLSEMVTTVEKALAKPVTAFSLAQNYPNPFNPETRIAFNLKESGWVALTVYDLLGHKVVDLVKENLRAGAHAVIWDGRDQVGNPVSSGTYFYQLETNGLKQVRKMMLMK